MNREIKFRLWDKELGKFRYDFSINSEGRVYVPPTLEGESVTYFTDSLVLRQWTGLLDRNSKEIYEGDILKCTRNYWDKPRNLIIKWDDVSAGFFLLDKHDPVDSESLDRESAFVVQQHEREVIGNIYDNPELLKEKV